MKIRVTLEWADQVEALLNIEPLKFKTRDTTRDYKISREQSKLLEKQFIVFEILHH